MRIDDDSLLQALYEGMFEAPLWKGFLSKLLAKTGSASVKLLFQPSDADRIIALSAGIPVALDGFPLPDGSLLNEDALPFRAMRPNRVYALEELLDLADGKAMIASPVSSARAPKSHMRLIRVTEPGGLDLWLLCSGRHNIGSSTSALLNALAPHLQIALRSYAALEKERFRSSVTGQAFDRLKIGWLSLDASCHIIDATDNLDQLFQWGGVLRRGRYDRLVPASPAIDRELTALMKSFAVNGDARPQAFNLSKDPWVEMLVTPHQSPNFSGSRTPVAIVYISGDRRSQADRCDQLVDLFGLLPSEARLAWMLAQATSIAEAADALGLTVETARNYSKKIYAKTGARGHAELVRIILTSVLAIS